MVARLPAQTRICAGQPRFLGTSRPCHRLRAIAFARGPLAVQRPLTTDDLYTPLSSARISAGDEVPFTLLKNGHVRRAFRGPCGRLARPSSTAITKELEGRLAAAVGVAVDDLERHGSGELEAADQWHIIERLVLSFVVAADHPDNEPSLVISGGPTVATTKSGVQ